MLVVVATILALLFPVLSKLRARAQRARCAANLRSLSVAANLYVQEHGMWPQISQDPMSPEPFAEAWITALKPFGAERETWICPTMHELLRKPDYSTPETARIDYIATPFDDKQASPHQWPRQPWFIERGDVHGHGNLIIFTDGSISDLRTVIQQSSSTR